MAPPTRRAALTLLCTAVGVGLVIGAATTLTRRDPVFPGKSAAGGFEGSSGAVAPEPEPTKKRDLPFSQVRLDFDKMPRGRSPVPYWDAADKSIHDGDRTIEAPRPEELTKVATGYALTTWVGDKQHLLALDANGSARTVEKYHTEVIRTADGKRLVWTNESGGSIITSDSRGRGRREHRLPEAIIGPEGWLGGSVIARLRTSEKPVLVDPDTGALRPVDAPAVPAASPEGDLVAIGTGESGTETQDCAEVREGVDGDAIWKTCTHMPVAFSPDGRFIVTMDAEGDTSFTIFEIRTGRPVLAIRNSGPGGFTWTTDSKRFVAQVYVQGRHALVACTLDGKCTAVTEPRKGPEPAGFEDDPDRPYVLSQLI